MTNDAITALRDRVHDIIDRHLEASHESLLVSEHVTPTDVLQTILEMGISAADNTLDNADAAPRSTTLTGYDVALLRLGVLRRVTLDSPTPELAYDAAVVLFESFAREQRIKLPGLSVRVTERSSGRIVKRGLL